MSNKLFLFIVCGIETLFLLQYENIHLFLINCFILCWIFKDIYIDFTTYSNFDSNKSFNNQYYYPYKGDNSWHQTTQNWYYSNKKKEEEIIKKIFQSTKPNMNIVLETDEQTKHMIEQKQRNISEIIEINNDNKKNIINVSEAIELQEIEATTQNKVKTCDSYIIIENDSYVSLKKTKVYDSILEFLKVTNTKDTIIQTILQNIIFVDLIEEIGNMVIYVKDINIFKSNSIDTNRLNNYIIAYSSVVKHIDIEQYKSLSIYEYYLNKTKNGNKI